MKKIQNSAATFFIFSIVVLTAISILGVWEIFGGEVIRKSFMTIGLLAGVSIVTIIAGRFMDANKAPVLDAAGQPVPEEINPAFNNIRNSTVVVLITSIALLALLGVLSIWEVVSGPVLHKSISSIAIIGFSSFLIIITCLERVNHPLMHKKISGSGIVGVLILLWIFFGMFSRFF
ncbi:hypothetical protein BH11PAT3_BH11PAT3_0480 [soil metagenome]